MLRVMQTDLSGNGISVTNMTKFAKSNFLIAKERGVIGFVYSTVMEFGIFGEGSQISTNQKRESTVF